MVINGISVDRDGVVWLTAAATLTRFANDTFARVARGAPWGLAHDADGVLWHAPAPAGGWVGAGKRGGDGADTVALPEGTSSFLAQDSTARWFRTPDGGVLRFDAGRGRRRWTGRQLGTTRISGLVRGGTGDYWLGGNGIFEHQDVERLVPHESFEPAIRPPCETRLCSRPLFS